MDEVFGAENFVVDHRIHEDEFQPIENYSVTFNDYLLWYAKDQAAQVKVPTNCITDKRPVDEMPIAVQVLIRWWIEGA